MSKHELILVILAVVFHSTDDALERHELITVTLFETDCNDPLAIQNCCETLSKHELILVILAVFSTVQTMHSKGMN